MKGDNFEEYPGGITAFYAAQVYFGNLDKDIDINALMKKVVLQGSYEKRDNIFVIMAESFSN